MNKYNLKEGSEACKYIKPVVVSRDGTKLYTRADLNKKINEDYELMVKD